MKQIFKNRILTLIPKLLVIWFTGYQAAYAATVHKIFPRNKEVVFRVSDNERNKFNKGDRANIFIPTLTIRLEGKLKELSHYYLVFKVRKHIKSLKVGTYVELTRTGNSKSTKASHFKRKGGYFKRARISLFGIGGGSPNLDTQGLGVFYGGGASLSYKKFEALGFFVLGYDYGFKEVIANTQEFGGAIRWHPLMSFNIKAGLSYRKIDLEGKREMTEAEAEAAGIKAGTAPVEGKYPIGKQDVFYYTDELALVLGIGNQWHFNTVTLGNSFVIGLDWFQLSIMLTVIDEQNNIDPTLQTGYPLQDIVISSSAYAGFTF